MRPRTQAGKRSRTTAVGLSVQSVVIASVCRVPTLSAQRLVLSSPRGSPHLILSSSVGEGLWDEEAEVQSRCHPTLYRWLVGELDGDWMSSQNPGRCVTLSWLKGSVARAWV